MPKPENESKNTLEELTARHGLVDAVVEGMLDDNAPLTVTEYLHRAWWGEEALDFNNLPPEFEAEIPWEMLEDDRVLP